jgi:hypothetical protein
MGQFITLANFLLFAGVRTAPGLFQSFGFDKSRPAFIAFVLFQYLVSPVDEVRRAGSTIAAPECWMLWLSMCLSMKNVCDCCVPRVCSTTFLVLAEISLRQ